MRYVTIFLLLISSLLHSQIEQNQLLHYSFDGNSNDLSGNGNHGTPFGGVTYVANRFGNANSAAYFDGVDDYINFPNIATLKPNLPVSFSFWIKYNNASYQKQVVFNTSFENNRSAGVWFNSTDSDNKCAVNFGDGTNSFTSSTRRTYVSYNSIDINVWHHIVVVVTSTTDMKIYFDCQDIGGFYNGIANTLVYSSNPGCIGRHDRDLSMPADYFNGTLDEFRYWDRALTSAEIIQLCTNNLEVGEVAAKSDKFMVYPNPTSDFLNFDTNIEGLELLTIYNSIGKEVYKNNFETKVDVSSLPAGIYFVKAKNDNETFTRKIVIN